MAKRKKKAATIKGYRYDEVIIDEAIGCDGLEYITNICTEVKESTESTDKKLSRIEEKLDSE